MLSKDRQGNLISANENQDKVLEMLYRTAAGRQILKILTMPEVSKIGATLLDSRLSVPFIKGFIRKNHIDMNEYEEDTYQSYNHFFTRHIKEGKRPFASNPQVLCAPCDSKLTVHSISPEGGFHIKHTIYTMDSLVRSKKLARHYYGGLLCIFRLTVDDYHHYAYVDSGKKTRNFHIPGVLHTVNPIANDVYPIYTENTREFSVLQSENFGNILMMEVGALMVGKIVNHHEETTVERGLEKGFFEFGGSTVVLAFEPGKVQLDTDILTNSQKGFETKVKMGERIGEAG